MFDIADKALVWIPVRWPGLKANEDELAEPVENEIDVLAEIVDRDKLRVIFPGGEDPNEGDPAAQREAEKEKFLALVHDWRKLKNGGSPLPFTPDNVDKLLAVPMFATGFERSYIAAWTGQVEYREKNSESSSSGGRAEKLAGAKPGARRKS